MARFALAGPRANALVFLARSAGSSQAENARPYPFREYRQVAAGQTAATCKTT
ncbi:MAG: hypothetical protein ACRYFK_20850 [Janthinobacterium lividum]